MDPGETQRRVGEIVLREEGPDVVGRLVLGDEGTLRMLVVEEIVSDEASRLPNRSPRRHRIVRGNGELPELLAEAPLDEIARWQHDYRDPHALRSVPPDMADELSAVIADWEAHGGPGSSLRVRLGHVDEQIVACRVSRSALRLWVGLRSGKVLLRRQATVGMATVASGAAVLLSLPGAPLAGAVVAGTTGAAVGALVSAVVLLGAVVRYGGSKAMTGVGERSD